jgi:hypothetical protein
MKIHVKLSANTVHEKMFLLVPTIILNRSWGVWSVAVTWLSAGLVVEFR